MEFETAITGPTVLAAGFAMAVANGRAEAARFRAADAGQAANIHAASAGAWASAAGDCQGKLIGAEARIAQLEMKLDESESMRRKLSDAVRILMDENDRLISRAAA